jgi:hypothetical protein
MTKASDNSLDLSGQRLTEMGFRWSVCHNRLGQSLFLIKPSGPRSVSLHPLTFRENPRFPPSSAAVSGECPLILNGLRCFETVRGFWDMRRATTLLADRPDLRPNKYPADRFYSDRSANG